MEKKFNKNILLSDTIIIACITIIGYYSAYIYQAGRFVRFSIPSQFIKIDITNVIVSISNIFFFIVINIFINAILRKMHKYFSNLAIFILSLTYSIILSILVSLELNLHLILVLISINFIVIFFEKINAKKNKYQYKSDKNKNNCFYFLHNELEETRIQSLTKVFAIVFTLVTLFSMVIGILDSYFNNRYLILKGELEQIVIYQYGNTMIVSNFDYNKNTMEKKYRIIEISDYKNMYIEYRKISNLKID